jgi:two-component system chemotaxis response regulator CheY
VKCLVVEPSATLRRALRNALRGLGADEILEAAEGQQAVAMGDASLDLLITEWAVPGLSGVELVKRVRANPETSNVSVLMLTSRNGKEDVLEALHAGVNGYLLKPFTLEALLQSIQSLLAAAGDEAQAA